MKAFEYYAPAALEEAFDLLDRFEAEGKLLNGMSAAEIKAWADSLGI